METERARGPGKPAGYTSRRHHTSSWCRCHTHWCVRGTYSQCGTHCRVVRGSLSSHSAPAICKLELPLLINSALSSYSLPTSLSHPLPILSQSCLPFSDTFYLANMYFFSLNVCVTFSLLFLLLGKKKDPSMFFLSRHLRTDNIGGIFPPTHAGTSLVLLRKWLWSPHL